MCGGTYYYQKHCIKVFFPPWQSQPVNIWWSVNNNYLPVMEITTYLWISLIAMPKCFYLNPNTSSFGFHYAISLYRPQKFWLQIRPFGTNISQIISWFAYYSKTQAKVHNDLQVISAKCLHGQLQPQNKRKRMRPLNHSSANGRTQCYHERQC